MTDRLPLLTILTRAAEGLGRVDRDGLRGTTQVTMNQVEAMAIALAITGLPPIRPDDQIVELDEYFSAFRARHNLQGDTDMSMSIHLGEGEIAEAIIRGDLSLSEIMRSMRSDLGSDVLLGDVIGTDVATVLDRGVPTEEMRAFLTRIEEAAEALVADADEEDAA